MLYNFPENLRTILQVEERQVRQLKINASAVIISGMLGYFLAGNAGARAPETGVGVMIGSPTGLSAKHWINSKMAVDGGLGASLESDVKFHVHADFLLQVPLKVPDLKGAPALYLGIGPRVRVIDKKRHSQKAELGFRLPIGLEYSALAYPLNFFLELAPVLVATPEGGVSLDGAVGVRYRFGK